MSDKLRAAAQAALDAMSVVRVFVTTEEKIKHPEGTDWYDNIRINLDDSIVNDIKEMNALEAALAEPEQEPVGKFSKFSDGVWKEVTASSPGQLLYTAPPRREWVGLKDADFEKEKFVDYNFMAGARFAESKLKEKNGG